MIELCGLYFNIYCHSFFPVLYREGETPVPIPNTAVKPLIADGTTLETARESRSVPG